MTLIDGLELVSNQAARKINLRDAVTGGSMALTITGAATLEVSIADHRRTLVRHPSVDTRSWAVADGTRFELVGMKKSGDQVALVFEDSIVAALRRHTKPLTAKANTTSRAGFAIRLAREARVPYRVDPTKRELVHNPLQRSPDKDKTSSWDVLNQEVASPVNWRVFSDGRQLVVGSDAWLASEYAKPVTLRENSSGVGSIDFDLDVGKRVSQATTTVDVAAWNLRPGMPVWLAGVGPADGSWLVSEVRRTLTGTRAGVTLVRKQHVLKEPKKQSSGSGSGGGSRAAAPRSKDSGDTDFVPTPTGSAATAVAANDQRERMVKFALAQAGKPYVWGASGPGSYDCSGLVYAATVHAGKPLHKPSVSQWGTCRNAGKTIPVSEALKIRGALLFRIGVGPVNHVAISLGNGSTVEARGSAYGCGVFGNAASQGYTGAALWL